MRYHHYDIENKYLYWNGCFKDVSLVFSGCLAGILSNSSPTCRPNSTSVGLSSRSWLCFPTGRKKEEEEGRKNPHLASGRRNDPTCLNFGDCLVGVRKVFGNCLEGVWWLSRGWLNPIPYGISILAMLHKYVSFCEAWPMLNPTTGLHPSPHHHNTNFT